VRHEIHRLQYAAHAAITAVLPDHDVFQRAQVRHQPDILEAAGDPIADA
jgi:hypothetical protein